MYKIFYLPNNLKYAVYVLQRRAEKAKEKLQE